MAREAKAVNRPETPAVSEQGLKGARKTPVGLCSESMVTLVNKLGAGLNKVNWTDTVCLQSQPPECRSFSLDAASDLQRTPE
ncbi:hypothetical protein EYF80_030296 [Liparis tanakae]|uniref:Uncharacterized protein n=1 Tax=Liparis tanakae TaxID=230148 RepID=A0A4Z2H1N1_9TELE|nr:hypothetical protein EYF80_030296 [Liparis tanakae]